MTEIRAGRPSRLVTTCAYLGLVGALQVSHVLIVLSSWDSTEGQAGVKRFTDPLVADGMARGDAEMVFRIYLGIIALLSASAVVFAIYTALGHAASRIMLTLAGGLVGLLCFTEGSFFFLVQGVIAYTCVFQLWSGDVRRWFAGSSGADAPTAGSPSWPPPLPPAPDHPVREPHPLAKPTRPGWVGTVAVLTLVVSSIAALGCVGFLLMYEFARERLVREQLDSGVNWMNLTEAEVRDGFHQLAVMSWVALPLCLLAMSVSAVLLLRRRQGR